MALKAGYKLGAVQVLHNPFEGGGERSSQSITFDYSLQMGVGVVN